MSIRSQGITSRFFEWVTHWPKTVLVLSGLLFIGVAAFIPQMHKDTSAEAFIPPDSPALIYRDKVKEIFGLKDPMVIAVVNEGENGIFNPISLEVVQWISDEVAKVPGIDPDKITSLATENNIIGNEEGMFVEPFLDPFPETLQASQSIRAAVDDFPLYVGSLVAPDGTATLVVAELLENADESKIYEDLLALMEKAPTQDESVYVAGEGAVVGYLGTYIDQDAQRLNPISALIITLVLIVAYRTVRAAVLPNLVVLAAVAGTLGTMAFSGISFFVITNGLIVILVGIAVADSIHILSEYYTHMRANPKATSSELVVDTMGEIARPITLTTLTTMAGFWGLYVASTMPPMKYFGLFALIGVGLAWLYSMTTVPAALTLLKPQLSPSFREKATSHKTDLFETMMAGLGRWVYRNTAPILVLSGLVTALGIWGATQLQVNEQRITLFKEDVPLRVADTVMNRLLDGTNYFDIVIEVPDNEGLFQPEHLQRIEAFQAYLESLPHVKGTTSIVDYLKQMNRSMNEGRAETYRLPTDRDLVAQYFLLYSVSGDPTDFDHVVDYDYRLANLRATLDTGEFIKIREVVLAAQQYIDTTFNTPGIQANLSGRVNLDYHWVRDLSTNHFQGVALSILLVLVMASLVFRSFYAGVLSTIPTVLAVLLIYAVMGFFDIWLAVGTSMFAAIAIGLGVDFAIHTLDRFIALLKHEQLTLEKAMEKLYPTTGRALMFNFVALVLGFGVLTISQVPALNRFGILVGMGVLASFVGSLVLLPALIKALKPGFLNLRSAALSKPSLATARSTGALSLSILLGIGLLAGSILGIPQLTHANGLPDGLEIVQKVNARDEGVGVRRDLKMILTDKRGKQRIRDTKGFRKYFGEEKRTVLFFKKPSNLKDTGFLTYDYPNVDKDDDQWLYLPALRKVRRISASDRGDYFLGTDFTYEDMKKENKVTIEDYHFKTLAQEEINGVMTYKVEMIPKSDDIKKELGYSKVVSWIDPNVWISRKSEYWDVAGNALKTIQTSDIRQIDGIWTVHRIEAKNHKTGHQTVFEFSNVKYEKDIAEKYFTQRRLKRGL